MQCLAYVQRNILRLKRNVMLIIWPYINIISTLIFYVCVTFLLLMLRRNGLACLCADIGKWNIKKLWLDLLWEIYVTMTFNNVPVNSRILIPYIQQKIFFTLIYITIYKYLNKYFMWHQQIEIITLLWFCIVD